MLNCHFSIDSGEDEKLRAWCMGEDGSEEWFRASVSVVELRGGKDGE